MMNNVFNRRDFLRALGIGAGALIAPGCISEMAQSAARSGKDRPNIIFIMTDDQGPWAFGAAPDVNARTPNIDRLCRQGARLGNYFVTTPVCSPSRAALMTSRYSTELGIPDFLNSRVKERGLDPRLPTWPRMLKNAGYATALIGKWHLGTQDKYYPTHYGYDEFKGFRTGGKISKDPMVEINGKVRQVPGYTPDILTDLAIDFVRRKKAEPFLLSLHFWAPHANTDNRTPDGDRTWLPLSDADWGQFKDSDPTLPDPDYPKLDTARTKRMMREYLASVAGVDRNLGRLLALLDELNLTENTVVIFTSDNGFNMGHNAIWHKGNGRWLLLNDRGPRPNMYDNSLKVPAIIRWPGVIEPEKTVEQTVTNLDWFATICAMAGVSLPDDTRIRGRDFGPLLKGQTVAWNNDLFAQYTMWPWHQTGAVLRTYRTPRWKLVRDFKHETKDELYDLVLDFAETRNLIDSTDPTVQKKRELLNQKLLEKMHDINDPALVAE
jgi:uncharacterized sulfatase